MTDTDLDPNRRAPDERRCAPARTDMTVAEVRRVAAQMGGPGHRAVRPTRSTRPRRWWSWACPRATRWRWPPTSRTTPGSRVSIAVAFEHPTIESLATWIVEGDPEIDSADDDDTDWTRTGPVERVDIAVVGLATRLPGDMNTPDETWQALLEGRDAITDLPEGRWSEFMEEPRLAERDQEGPHPRRLPHRHQGLRLRVLRAVQDRSRQHRPAAADDAGADLGGARARPHPGVQPARRVRRRIRRHLGDGLQLPGDVGPDRRPPVCDHRYREFDCGQPGFVLLRLPRPVGRGGHRLLELAGRHPSGGAGAAQRRMRRGDGRRGQRADHPRGDAGLRRDRRRCSRPTAGSSRSRRTPTATPAPRAARCWCSSGSTTRAATATRSSP